MNMILIGDEEVIMSKENIDDKDNNIYIKVLSEIEEELELLGDNDNDEEVEVEVDVLVKMVEIENPIFPAILEVIIEEEEGKKKEEEKQQENENENMVISKTEINNLSDNLIQSSSYYLLNEIVHLINIKLVMGNISLCQYTFKIVVKIIIETIESYMDIEIHKDKKKHFAVKIMESLIKKMCESNDKEFFNTMIINGVFENIVDLIIESSKGKIKINKSVKTTTGIFKFKSYFSNCVDFFL